MLEKEKAEGYIVGILFPRVNGKNGGGHISKMQGRGAGSSCGSQYFTTIWPRQTTRTHD
jgi:hypothetical protein